MKSRPIAKIETARMIYDRPYRGGPLFTAQAEAAALRSVENS